MSKNDDIIYDFKKEQKKRAFKARVQKVKNTVKATGKWVCENPDKAIQLAGAAVAIGGGAVKIAKYIDHKRTVKQLETLKNLRVYDHRTNQYLKLKRPMKAKEALEFERRVMDGETKAKVLSALGLLADH